MKKTILNLILLIIAPMICKAQQDDYKVTSRGITIEKTIECQGKTAGQIFSKIVEYIDQAYNESNNVTKSADNINNQVIFSGYYTNVYETVKVTDWGLPNFIPLGKLPVDVHHHVKAKSEDGKLTIKILVDYYNLCRSATYMNCGCYDFKIPVTKVPPFGTFTEEDHKKYKLINKAMSGNPFHSLDECVKKQISDIQEFMNDDF